MTMTPMQVVWAIAVLIAVVVVSAVVGTLLHVR